MLVALLAGLHGAEAAAQTLSGRILEEGREIPVAEATVSLVDAEGRVRARAVSDAAGRFTLTPPRAGEYVVEVSRIGYATTRSPLLALAVEGAASLDLLIRPEPVGLEGLEVTTRRPAEELLAPFGLRREELGDRWIDRDAIDRVAAPAGPADVIAWTPAAGIRVDLTDGQNGVLCVRVRQSGKCASVYLNGIHIDSVTAASLDPTALEAIAILRPWEAATFFGTLVPGGAVLLWTRSGRR